ncbi:hypothetical protein [Nitrosomonas supralitoralis]|uniref:Uncharacterized protein n=1 Tax=Nitrosomonas supralitoralis TaxID=2116706 RepID=A0A2P7NY06_9PROT|nr:hypothetical protein [Nitrosomonas supralitoralis]PSJ18334.1 hypothetical protein C7H79_02890 [Nitrosomonas supralitoralis]
MVFADGSAGNFKSSEDIPDLLFKIDNSLNQIRCLYNVGKNADEQLKHPELYRDSKDIKSVK